MEQFHQKTKLMTESFIITLISEKDKIFKKWIFKLIKQEWSMMIMPDSSSKSKISYETN